MKCCHRDFRDPDNRVVPGTFTVTTVAECPLEDADRDADRLVLVDGFQIGMVYLCEDGGWACWGPASLTPHHPTWQAAVDAQVAAYAIDPAGFDRRSADALAEERAERAAREAVWQAELDAQEEADRRRRLGDDEPGPTIWTLPAYHVLYAPVPETTAVSAWFGQVGADDVSAVHEVRVEQRATRRVVVFEQPHGFWLTSRRAPTRTRVVTCEVDPPPIATPARPDLHDLLEEHWPTRFPLIDGGRTMACKVCTRSWKDLKPGESLHDVLASWPCPPLTAAIKRQPAMLGAAR